MAKAQKSLHRAIQLHLCELKVANSNHENLFAHSFVFFMW